MLLGQLAPLHTQVALRDDVLAVAAHLDHPAVLDVDLDPADGVAEPAEGLVRRDHRLAYG